MVGGQVEGRATCVSPAGLHGMQMPDSYVKRRCQMRRTSLYFEAEARCYASACVRTRVCAF